MIPENTETQKKKNNQKRLQNSLNRVGKEKPSSSLDTQPPTSTPKLLELNSERKKLFAEAFDFSPNELSNTPPKADIASILRSLDMDLAPMVSEVYSIPSDNDGLLYDIEDCKKLIESLSDLGNVICPDLLLECRKFLLVSGEKIKNTPNQLIKDTRLNHCKSFTLNVVKRIYGALIPLPIEKDTSQDELTSLLGDSITSEVSDIESLDLKAILEWIEERVKGFNNPHKFEVLTPIFKDSKLVPTVGGPAMASSCKAFSNKGLWQKDKTSGEAIFQHQKSDDPSSVIKHYIRDWKDATDIKKLPFDQAEQILDKFGVHTALLHFILASHAFISNSPSNHRFKLKGTNLINDLGLAKRRDLTQHEKLKKVNDTVNAVRSLLISAKWTGEIKKGRKTITCNVSLEPSIMWDIVPQKISHPTAFLDDDEEIIEEIIFTVRVGLWIDEFFNKAGRDMGKALYNFATLSKRILELNPYKEELALRIALIQSQLDYRQYMKVETWLIENLNGGADRIKKARLGSGYLRKDLKNVWDNTLKSLERIGFNIDFDNESYPENLRPDNPKNPRGYFEQLLKAKVKITPETINKSKLENIKPTQSNPTPKIYSGKDLKKIRLASSITPKQIIKYLDEGVTGKIYNLEKRDNISKKLYHEVLDAINYIKKHPDKF